MPIARFTADPTVLVVRANSPWKTAKDFIAAFGEQDAKVMKAVVGRIGKR